MKDTIYRQDAVDAFVKFSHLDWEYLKIMNPVLTVLESLPPAEPDWIPVTDRLPEEETDVLVCNANGDIEISSGSYSTEVKDFIWYTSGWRFGKVIAWMPLPKSYSERR